MTVDAATTISAGMIAQRLKAMPARSTEEERVQHAFEQCLLEANTWMCGDDDDKFRAGAGGLLIYYYERDKAVFDRIGNELNALQAVSSLIQGVPVNMEAVNLLEKPLGLLEAWHAAKGK